MDLNRAKSQIRLPDFAGANGWAIDRNGGLGRSVQMRRSDGSAEIVVSLHGRWVYFRRDGSSKGSIIDFCQAELGLSWHHTIKTLAEAMESPPPPAPLLSFPTVNKSERPPVPAIRGTDCRPYLESRGITPATVEHFRESIGDGPGGAVQFPHTGGGGEGHEYRGPNAKGFSKGGKKGFWLHRPEGAESLVICESGIDCMSYAQAHGLPRAAYASTGGGCRPETIRAIVEEARTMPGGIIIATDADEAGGRLGKAIAEEAITQGVAFDNDQPKAKDWNAELAEITQSAEKA